MQRENGKDKYSCSEPQPLALPNPKRCLCNQINENQIYFLFGNSVRIFPLRFIRSQSHNGTKSALDFAVPPVWLYFTWAQQSLPESKYTCRQRLSASCVSTHQIRANKTTEIEKGNKSLGFRIKKAEATTEGDQISKTKGTEKQKTTCDVRVTPFGSGTDYRVPPSYFCFLLAARVGVAMITGAGSSVRSKFVKLCVIWITDFPIVRPWNCSAVS